MPRQEDSTMNRDDDDSVRRGDWELPSDLKSLEAKLATLRPRQDRIDREHFIFLAGQASVRPTRTWPVAFAAMTAVAATLFGLLIARPIVEPQSPPTRTVVQVNGPNDLPRKASVEPATGHSDRPTVLSASDAYLRDIEQLLARNNWPIGANSADVKPPIENRDRSVLTPSSWRQLFDGSEFAIPSSSDSSSLCPFRGTNS